MRRKTTYKETSQHTVEVEVSAEISMYAVGGNELKASPSLCVYVGDHDDPVLDLSLIELLRDSIYDDEGKNFGAGVDRHNSLVADLLAVFDKWAVKV